MSNILVEKWAELIESDKAPLVQAKEVMAQLLENQEVSMNESSVASDIAQYTPILVPAVRRIFPNLLANELVGVQALKQPTGYAYALRYVYGDGTGQTPTDRGAFNRGLTTGGAVFTDVGLILADLTAFPTVSSIIVANGVSGTVKYSEAGRTLVSFSSGADAITAVTAGGVVTGTGFSATSTVAGFQNEAGFNLIFKGYAGNAGATTWTTAAGETAGANIKNLNLKIERASVEAQTRRLKAEYTLEMAQDLKNIHGLDAEKELINIMEYEIGAELDRELIDLMNAKATVTPTWSYGGAGLVTYSATGTTPDGRWEAEKIRTLYNRLLREANQIALSTRRGSANFIVASSNVVAALETLQGFMYASVPGQVKPVLGVAKVGTLDGRFTVYMDTFAFTDYVTLGYKGSNTYDSGIIYCPYVPLQMQKVVDPVTFQPKIGFMTRDAIAGNMYGVQNYYRKFLVDFTGSSFGGGYNFGQSW
jgi:hypothetical protein